MKNAERLQIIKARMYARQHRERDLTPEGKDRKQLQNDMISMLRYRMSRGQGY